LPCTLDRLPVPCRVQPGRGSGRLRVRGESGMSLRLERGTGELDERYAQGERFGGMADEHG
jgi:hypothetical protein